MKKRTLFYTAIVMISVAISVIVGFTYYKDKNSLKVINITEIKAVKFFPFQGPNHAKEYNYDTKNPDDMEAINNMVQFLDTGKSLGIEKRVFILNGGTPERLVLELTNGQYIEISTNYASVDQVLVTQSSTSKTFIVYSPEFRKLFGDELKRISKS